MVTLQKQCLNCHRRQIATIAPPCVHPLSMLASGEWQVSARIFTGRLRVVSRGELAELQLTDPVSSELFAACPVPFGQRDQAVEPVSDSSRYFVLRLVRELFQRLPAHASMHQLAQCSLARACAE